MHYEKEHDKYLSKIGSRIVCNNKRIIVEESEQAYKNIENIIEDLLKEQITSIICSMTPVITCK